MKPNAAQGTYRAVSQNPQTEEAEEPKKASSHESVIENGQNTKTTTNSKEFQDDAGEDEKKPMSPIRKFCFVLSLLQCVLFIVAFGWLIPCKIPRHSSKSHSQNWKLNYYDEDFVTNLVVTSSDHEPVAVVFGFRSFTNGSSYGVRAVRAFDGSSMWETNTVINKPVDIVCGSLDIDSDGTPDCIVTNDAGQMFALSARNGQDIWYMHEHHTILNPQAVSKPVVGKSCHSGSVPNIYVAVQDAVGTFFFVIVSSSTGRIEEIYKLPECVAMPENMMWRTSKADHDEIDAPLELVMSCANKAGNAIIYNANADELCKNDTSQSFNAMFFKLAIVNGARFPLRMELLKTDTGDNLAVLTHNDEIHVYSEVDAEQVQFTVDSEYYLKDFVVGHFTNNSIANIIVLTSSNSPNSNTLLLLDKTHSHILKSFPIENGTATSISVVHNALDSLDTVMVKIISEQTNVDESSNVTDSSLNIRHFEEKQAILRCFDTGSFGTITEDVISASCHETDCNPKIFDKSNSAVLSDVDSDGKEELLYFTHKSLPSSLVQPVTLKLTRLSDPEAKTCSTCHC